MINISNEICHRSGRGVLETFVLLQHIKVLCRQLLRMGCCVGIHTHMYDQLLVGSRYRKVIDLTLCVFSTRVWGSICCPGIITHDLQLTNGMVNGWSCHTR
jgi:hypothetical protein